MLSRLKQASRYIFATQTDVKSMLRIIFRMAILTEDFYVRSYRLVLTGYQSLIKELQKRRLMIILSPHSCETYKQCTQYAFARFLLHISYQDTFIWSMECWSLWSVCQSSATDREYLSYSFQAVLPSYRRILADVIVYIFPH